MILHDFLMIFRNFGGDVRVQALGLHRVRGDGGEVRVALLLFHLPTRWQGIAHGILTGTGPRDQASS